jgi:hypothetical protein
MVKEVANKTSSYCFVLFVGFALLFALPLILWTVGILKLHSFGYFADAPVELITVPSLLASFPNSNVFAFLIIANVILSVLAFASKRVSLSLLFGTYAVLAGTVRIISSLFNRVDFTNYEYFSDWESPKDIPSWIHALEVVLDVSLCVQVATFAALIAFMLEAKDLTSAK